MTQEEKLQQFMDEVRELELRVAEEKKALLDKYKDCVPFQKPQEFVAGYWQGANTYSTVNNEVIIDSEFNVRLFLRYSKIKKDGELSKARYFHEHVFYYFVSAKEHISKIQEFLKPKK